MSTSSDKIMKTYMKAKEKDATLGFYMVGCDVLGEHSTRIIIGSSTPIDINAARQFIFASCGNKLIPFNESFKNFSDKNNYYASMIAYRSAIQHITEEAGSKFTQISANSYLDTDLNQVWEKENIEGKNFFLRNNNDSLEEIMQNALYITSSSTVNASVDKSIFNESLVKDNFVEFFTLNTEGKPGKALGQVVDINASTNQLTVKVMQHEIAIPLRSVINKINMEAASSKQEVLNYLEKAYPDAYKEMLKKVK